jgi:hypothetical protein
MWYSGRKRIRFARRRAIPRLGDGDKPSSWIRKHFAVYPANLCPLCCQCVNGGSRFALLILLLAEADCKLSVAVEYHGNLILTHSTSWHSPPSADQRTKTGANEKRMRFSGWVLNAFTQ